MSKWDIKERRKLREKIIRDYYHWSDYPLVVLKTLATRKLST